MAELIVASEALASGEVTRQVLRTRYVKVHRNVYALSGAELDAAHRAVAAWLWSRREATVVGISAAALLGTRWLSAAAPAELARVRHSAPRGIVVHTGVIHDDELRTIGRIRCTTAARTAYDIGRRTAGETAVIRLDALMNATRVTVCEIASVAESHPGARGVRQLGATLGRVDGGAESPQETRLRLLLVDSGLPRPLTQIPVRNEFGRVVRRIDMGYPEWCVGVEYDGEHHFTGPDDYADDIERLEFLANMGWTIVRVSARQLRYDRARIVHRVRTALARAGAQYV